MTSYFRGKKVDTTLYKLLSVLKSFFTACKKFQISKLAPVTVKKSFAYRIVNNVAERVRKMSIRFSLFVHTHNVLSLSWD